MSKRKINASPKIVKPWKHNIMKIRREEAEKRNSAYNKLTIQQKLAKLDMNGYAATKQRFKLNSQIKKP